MALNPQPRYQSGFSGIAELAHVIEMKHENAPPTKFRKLWLEADGRLLFQIGAPLRGGGGYPPVPLGPAVCWGKKIGVLFGVLWGHWVLDLPGAGLGCVNENLVLNSWRGVLC